MKHKLLYISILFVPLLLLFVNVVVEGQQSFPLRSGAVMLGVFQEASDPIERGSYTISKGKLEYKLREGLFFEDFLEIENTANNQMTVTAQFSGDIIEVVELHTTSVSIQPGEIGQINYSIFGKEVLIYGGTLLLSGSVDEEIPINVTIVEEHIHTLFLTTLKLKKEKITRKNPLGFDLTLNKLTPSPYNLSINYSLRNLDTNESTALGFDSEGVGKNSISFSKEFDLPEDLAPAEYLVYAEIQYENRTTFTSGIIDIRLPFLEQKIYGQVPVWLVLLILGTALTIYLTYRYIKYRIKKSKKYQMDIEYGKIPSKPGPNMLFMGRIAETNRKMYFDVNNLTTHCIDAGATGGGKSISAQVIVEECLMKDVAVIVFDPTAQWSGMLRKCEDKKMFTFYPTFGMKPQDARAFNGNVRQIKDAREKIDLKRYMKPGEIQIFAVNTLTPEQFDIFMANTIVTLFHANLEEKPHLRLLLVYDEVHRLLPKFGGSGQGFIQIERACREFRKWGVGVLLISQVLSDFMGEIKANINTEIQMRTRDEGDLERIKTKYSATVLQSLVRSSVGVGIMVNTLYNNGKPFFLNFRPILHSVKRLGDDELEKYNKYNDIIDELEWQIELLETEEKIDVFDLKLELKLALDKVKSGNFNMVDIYLEGLKPRMEGQWKKLGKTPRKRELKLVSQEELDAAIAKAKEDRAKEEAKEKKTEKKEEKKKEDILRKNVKPFTFDNGMMIASFKELYDVFDVVNEEIFKGHVTEEKNQIAEWVKENFNEEMSGRLQDKLTRDEMLAELKKMVEEIEEKNKKEAEGEKKEE